jgi:putative DNA primase/helicase
MIDNRPQHACASCHLCEAVPPDGFRRCWKREAKAGYWHTIADGPELMGRLPRQAHFLTMLASRPGPDDSPTHYRGPLYGEFDAEAPAQAFDDLRRCLELLHSEYDCPFEAIRAWHSGRRGPHWTIPPVVIGAEAGHPQLPRIYVAMVQRLFPSNVAPTVDRSVYSGGQGRMWRLPNRRRSDTGRYKVPLSIREVLHKPYADLEALTVRPRKGIFWPADDELAPCSALVQLYQETAAAIDHPTPTRTYPAQNGSSTGGDVEVLLSRCAFIRHCRDDASVLTEPEWYAMVSNVARCTDGPAAVHRLSAPYPDYSPQETEEKMAHALQAPGPHTCTFIQGFGFQGCPPGGCGVKAPIALSHHRDSPLRRRREAEDLARRLLQRRIGGAPDDEY